MSNSLSNAGSTAQINVSVKSVRGQVLRKPFHHQCHDHPIFVTIAKIHSGDKIQTQFLSRALVHGLFLLLFFIFLQFQAGCFIFENI